MKLLTKDKDIDFIVSTNLPLLSCLIILPDLYVTSMKLLSKLFKFTTDTSF